MIEHVVAYVLRNRVEATLVVPEWTGHLWWPFLLPIVTDRVKLKRRDLIGKDSAEIWRNSAWNFVVLKVNGARWRS
jgi:hypothetical protein